MPTVMVFTKAAKMTGFGNLQSERRRRFEIRRRLCLLRVHPAHASRHWWFASVQKKFAAKTAQLQRSSASVANIKPLASDGLSHSRLVRAEKNAMRNRFFQHTHIIAEPLHFYAEGVPSLSPAVACEERAATLGFFPTYSINSERVTSNFENDHRAERR